MSNPYTTFEKTTSTQVRTVPGKLSAIEVITDGSNDAVCIGYDVDAAADAAAGNKLFEFTVTSTDNYGGRDWRRPIPFGKGLYITISGTGASFIAEWMK